MSGVGFASQLMSLFKLFFGHPNLLIIKELETKDQQEKSCAKKLIKSMSTVYNHEHEDMELDSVVDG